MAADRRGRNNVTALVDKNLNAHSTCCTYRSRGRWVRGLGQTGCLTVQYAARDLFRNRFGLGRRRGRRSSAASLGFAAATGRTTIAASTACIYGTLIIRRRGICSTIVNVAFNRIFVRIAWRDL